MIKVELALYDAQEAAWFAQFSNALMQYRDAKANEEFVGSANPLGNVTPPAQDWPASNPEDAQTIAEATVIGHIAPEPPTLAELTAAVQASLVGDAMPAQVEKVKGLLARYGAKVLSEVPEDKRAELIGSL